MVLQKWCHAAVECHDTVDDIIWKRGASTHFSRRNTLSATLHGTDSSYPEIPRWLEWKNAVVQRITLRDARTVPVASPSAMILQLKKENYHLALFTFKGVSSNDMKKMPWCKESRCVMHGQSL